LPARLRRSLPPFASLAPTWSIPLERRIVGGKGGAWREATRSGHADDIAATIAGTEPPALYEAPGVCYAEFGGGLVSKVEINFLGGDAPTAQRYDPSLGYAAEKEEFGAVRRARWFGRS
jgi:sulfide:quinone oxidoreductase